MRRSAAAALAALALAAAGVSGCGDDAQSAAPAVSWDGPPAVARHPELPGDRIATGRMRNDSGEELRLDVASARLLDASGHRIRASVRFAAGVTHSLYPPRDAPHETPRQMQERLGDAATIEPGRSAPLTIAWHARDGTPVRVDFGRVSLAVP